MRIAAGDDLEPGALQARHGIRRRHLDPVDLTRAQRGKPRRRLRHREQHHLVQLGHAILFPIAVVPAQRHADARLEFRDLERARARGRLGELGPRSRLLELRRARIEHVGQHVGEVAERPRVGDLDRVVVDLAVARNEGVARLRDSAARRIELLGVLLVVAIEVPDRGVGVEITAVMELHALAQVEDPFRLVVGVLLPSLGQARPDVGQLVRALQVPQHQPLEDGVAKEAHALIAVVRCAGRHRHVGRGHRDPQGSPRQRPTCRQQRQHGAKASKAACAPHRDHLEPPNHPPRSAWHPPSPLSAEARDGPATVRARPRIGSARSRPQRRLKFRHHAMGLGKAYIAGRRQETAGFMACLGAKIAARGLKRTPSAIGSSCSSSTAKGGPWRQACQGTGRAKGQGVPRDRACQGTGVARDARASARASCQQRHGINAQRLRSLREGTDAAAVRRGATPFCLPGVICLGLSAWGYLPGVICLGFVPLAPRPGPACPNRAPLPLP